MTRTVTPSELKALLARGDDIALLDVRRKQDYDADPVRVPGATWHDPEKLAEWAERLPKKTAVVLYCVRGGSVSNAVVDALRVRGRNARFIEGGIEAWKAAGGQTMGK